MIAKILVAVLLLAFTSAQVYSALNLPPCFSTEICGSYHWTQWMDRDNPSGTGDFEDNVNLLISYPGIACANPMWVQCKTTTGVNWWQSGEVVYMHTNYGCRCWNKHQPGNKVCQLDYKVRQLCP